MGVHKTQVCGYFRTYCQRSNDTTASKEQCDALETGELVKRENSGFARKHVRDANCFHR